MTATRSPYETFLNEADYIGQRARAAAEFAAPVDPRVAHLFEMCAERAERSARSLRRRIRGMDKAAAGDGTND